MTASTMRDTMQTRCYFSGADNSESVICIAKVWRKARARGVSPRNAGDWLARIIEMRIVAKRWRLELRVFDVRHLACADLECVDPNSMERTLVVLAVFRTHHEPCTRDGDHARTTLFPSPATVSHAAPGKRCASSSTSCMAPRNQSQSCCVIVIGGRNLITSV